MRPRDKPPGSSKGNHMSYKTELAKKVLNPKLWPDFERRDFLGELDGIAEDAFLYNTIYGYLSAVLIYHQLADEVIQVLLNNSRFFIQLSIFPVELNFPIKKDKMFGELLQDLESTVEFEQKKLILQKARKLNSIRIQIVHKLTKQSSLDEVKTQAVIVKKLFYEILDLCRDANSYFFRVFDNFKKAIDWKEYLEEI